MRSLVDRLLDSFGLHDANPAALKRYDLDVLTDPGAQRSLKITHRVLRCALRQIKQVLAPDIAFLLLKGEPLETLLFNGSYPRATGDIDLLILPGDLDEARGRLEALRYRPVLPEAPRRWAHNQQAFIHARHGVIVELHWSPTLPGVPTLPLFELFEHRQRFDFPRGLSVDVLSTDWLFFHLALHFHHHIGFAKGLVDLAGWCDRYAEEFKGGELRERASRLGIQGLVQWPLHTILQLTGPSRSLRPLIDHDIDATVRAWATTSARAMRRCLIRYPGTDLQESLTAIMHDLDPLRGVSLQALSMLTLDGWPQKIGGLCRPFLLGPHPIGRRVYHLTRRFSR